MIALTAACVGWGLTIPSGKVALGWLDPLTLGAARFALAAPVLALAGRRGLRAALDREVIAWGVVFYAAVVGLQNAGVARTSVSHAALIVGAVPAFVALAMLARGEARSGPAQWAGFLLALAGAGLVAGPGGAATLGGDLLVLCSAALSALYLAAQPPLLRGRDPVAVTAVQMAAGALATIPVALALEGAPQAAASAGDLGAFAALVGVGSVAPFALYAWGQARVGAEVAGAFVNLETVVGAAVGAVAFHDPLGPAQAAGALAILGGLLLGAQAPGEGPAAEAGEREPAAA